MLLSCAIRPPPSATTTWTVPLPPHLLENLEDEDMEIAHLLAAKPLAHGAHQMQ